MNTKSMPAILALVAGFVTCIISFIQRVDTVVFAKKFIIVCIIFFAIGTVIRIVIQMNFKDILSEEEHAADEEAAPGEARESEEGSEDSEKDADAADESGE